MMLASRLFIYPGIFDSHAVYTPSTVKLCDRLANHAMPLQTTACATFEGCSSEDIVSDKTRKHGTIQRRFSNYNREILESPAVTSCLQVRNPIEKISGSPNVDGTVSHLHFHKASEMIGREQRNDHTITYSLPHLLVSQHLFSLNLNLSDFN